MNKVDLITPEQLGEVRAIVRSLQKDAVMIEAEHGIVPLEELLDTGRFDFDKVYQSAAWLDIMMSATRGDHDEHDADGHEHHGHHHHHHHGDHHGHDHEEGEELEYGFSSFVYERRKPFDLDRFSDFAANWPNSVIRTKGMVWVSEQPDVCYLLEQAGTQRVFIDNGPFVAALPEDEQAQVLAENPGIANRWDERCGDRLTMLVFIGRNMDQAAIEGALDECLTDWEG